MSNENKHRRQDDELKSKQELLHEMQVNQIELEMQNLQLREAQQQLEESRDRYADLYDFAPIGYLTLDETGIVQEINLTGAVMLDMDRLSIVAQPFVNFLVTASIQPFLAHLKQVFSAAGNHVVEISIREKNRSSRIVTLESVVNEDKKRTCRTVMHDVTLQRQMAAQLQISQSAQSALLKAIPALVFYLNVDLCFQNVSLAFADFVGRLPENIVGKSFHDLLPANQADEFHRLSTSVIQTGMALYGFENNIQDYSGKVICLTTVLAPFHDFQGKIIGLAGVSFDITNFKSTAMLNSELLLENRMLTRNLFNAQEEERRYLARELHDELGQWFTAIQAEAEVISHAAKYIPEIYDSALAIRQSARQVHEVIRSMLRKLRPSLLDELGLADSLRELERQWCLSHPDVECVFKLEISLEGLGEELNVTLYRLVQESLNNIANHAHAYNVLVSLGKSTDLESGAEFLLLKVEDDGIGFDSKQTRADLGLLGMRERVIAAGGDFYIYSQPGAGTKILAKLPSGIKARE